MEHAVFPANAIPRGNLKEDAQNQQQNTRLGVGVHPFSASPTTTFSQK